MVPTGPVTFGVRGQPYYTDQYGRQVYQYGQPVPAPQLMRRETPTHSNSSAASNADILSSIQHLNANSQSFENLLMKNTNMQVKNTNLLIELEAKINMLTEKYNDSENTVYALPQKQKNIDFSVNTHEMTEMTAVLTRNTLGKLGMQINPDKQITIVEEYGPAAKAEMKVNDMIVRVDNKVVKSLDEYETANMMKGNPNTLVRLTFLRKADEIFV